MLKGYVEVANLRQIIGWARDDAQPDMPVSLLITDNDQLVGRILANRYRADLDRAGIGHGRHSFDFHFSPGLTPFEKHVLRVRRETDGTDLARSPVTLEPSRAFDTAVQEALGDFIQSCGSDDEIVAKINFLVNHVDPLLKRLGDRDSYRFERDRYRQFLQRWRRMPMDASLAKRPEAVAPRALVIDDRIPRSDRDAGSLVILSHMQSLQRIGYEVAFTPADFEFDEHSAAALITIGVSLYRWPYYGSIEEVLRRQAGGFDLIYLHRVSNALKYGPLARHYNPRARQIFSVADLHHLRYARQAAAEQRPELEAVSQRLRFHEYVAAVSANAVITHSTHEMEVLAKQVPSSKIHTVLWSTPLRPTRVAFAKRSGVAFIGGYGHAPNLDAARWLINEIMPIVREGNPDIECFLVGSDMPGSLRQLCKDGVVAVGHVKDLGEIFDRIRLTVAPLTFGAGIKGKVIDSLGAGLPCVCTPIAAEGLLLPDLLKACVAETAGDLARLIGELHANEELNDACGLAGLDYVRAFFSNERLDAAMRGVLGPSAVPHVGAGPASGSNG